MTDAFGHAGHATALMLGVTLRTRRQGRQDEHQHDEAEGVEVEGRLGAEPADECAGERRTDETGAVEHRPVDRDGPGDVLAPGELGHDRRGRRHLEGGGDAEERRRDDDVPDGHLT